MKPNEHSWKQLQEIRKSHERDEWLATAVGAMIWLTVVAVLAAGIVQLAKIF